MDKFFSKKLLVVLVYIAVMAFDLINKDFNFTDLQVLSLTGAVMTYIMSQTFLDSKPQVPEIS